MLNQHAQSGIVPEQGAHLLRQVAVPDVVLPPEVRTRQQLEPEVRVREQLQLPRLVHSGSQDYPCQTEMRLVRLNRLGCPLGSHNNFQIGLPQWAVVQIPLVEEYCIFQKVEVSNIYSLRSKSDEEYIFFSSLRLPV